MTERRSKKRGSKEKREDGEEGEKGVKRTMGKEVMRRKEEWAKAVKKGRRRERRRGVGKVQRQGT
jgi:hypothetical protein